MPPPADAPIGWSPNAQSTTQAQISSGIQQLTAAELDAFLLSGRSVIQRSITLTHLQSRALNSVPQTVVPAPGVGLVAQPIYWVLQFANGAVGFGAQTQVSLRYAGNTVDLGTTQLISNVANAESYLTEHCGNQTFATGVTCENLAIQARAVADVTNGSGFSKITVAFLVLPVLP